MTGFGILAQPPIHCIGTVVGHAKASPDSPKMAEVREEMHQRGAKGPKNVSLNKKESHLNLISAFLFCNSISDLR